MRIGYTLASEEHDAPSLVHNAQVAEAVGFDYGFISDHFHPWVDRQGQSPFVWCTIGGIAQATSTLRIGTGVTCPIRRVHPAIVAQAAATAATLLPNRFFLGLGAGENLNEHIVGGEWPEPNRRLAMLTEAIGIIRLLWQGGEHTHHGEFFDLDEARVYSLPKHPPPLFVAGDGREAAHMAAQLGDGFIGVTPESKLINQFAAAGGAEKPRYGQVAVCYAERESEAKQIAHEWWPTAGLGGHLSWEIKTPALFQFAVKGVSEDDVADSIVCGADVDKHVEAIQRFADAGYDHVAVHQVGADQEGFFEFYEKRVLPACAHTFR